MNGALVRAKLSISVWKVVFFFQSKSVGNEYNSVFAGSNKATTFRAKKMKPTWKYQKLQFIKWPLEAEQFWSL